MSTERYSEAGEHICSVIEQIEGFEGLRYHDGWEEKTEEDAINLDRILTIFADYNREPVFSVQGMFELFKQLSEKTGINFSHINYSSKPKDPNKIDFIRFLHAELQPQDPYRRITIRLRQLDTYGGYYLDLNLGKRPKRPTFQPNVAEGSNLPVQPAQTLLRRLSDLSVVNVPHVSKVLELKESLERFGEILSMVESSSNYQKKLQVWKKYIAMNEGEHFPGANPLYKRDELKLLREGINLGLYTEPELNYALHLARQSPAFLMAHQQAMVEFRRIRTPFAQDEYKLGGFKSDKSTFKDFGFHVFIGYMRLGSDISVITNESESHGIVHNVAESAYKELVRQVKMKRKVLLAKSPGSYGPNGDIYNNRQLDTFSDALLSDLKNAFEKDPEMKGYRNPFSYQPTN